jgi:hypothetical protein
MTDPALVACDTTMASCEAALDACDRLTTENAELRSDLRWWRFVGIAAFIAAAVECAELWRRLG